jgi:hypothetical protein
MCTNELKRKLGNFTVKMFTIIGRRIKIQKDQINTMVYMEQGHRRMYVSVSPNGVIIVAAVNSSGATKYFGALTCCSICPLRFFLRTENHCAGWSNGLAVPQ